MTEAPTGTGTSPGNDDDGTPNGDHQKGGTQADDAQAALALAVILHDIRTPLGAVSATADLLAGTELDPRQRDFVTTLQQAAAALTDLTDELLRHAGEVPPHPAEPVDWNPAGSIGALLDLFAPLADRQGVRLIRDIDPAADRAAAGDPNAVRRILTNLIDNAIKFAGGGEVRVAARLAEGDELTVTVDDSGPGIAPAELETLFLPYRQGQSGLRRRSGSGLGLWISRTLAQRLGGALEVESREGRGTRFTLRVPLPAAPAHRHEPSAAAEAVDAAGLKVLVVDDNSVNRLLITTFLDSFGMTFRAVASGAEALQAAAEDAYDLVVMDLQMPDMDGIETALKLRAVRDTAEIPIIALTAGMRPADSGRYRRAGFAAILGKPFAPGDLLAALTSAARKTREA